MNGHLTVQVTLHPRSDPHTEAAWIRTDIIKIRFRPLYPAVGAYPLILQPLFQHQSLCHETANVLNQTKP